jgi:hypothetical protein
MAPDTIPQTSLYGPSIKADSIEGDSANPVGFGRDERVRSLGVGTYRSMEFVGHVLLLPLLHPHDPITISFGIFDREAHAFFCVWGPA